MQRSLLILLSSTVLIAFAGACGGANEAALDPTDGAGTPRPAADRSDRPFKIVVSLAVFGEFAELMAGDHAVVTVLIPPGADPHTHVPDDSLALAVEEADMIFYNGLNLEGPTQSFIERNLADRPPLVIDFARNVPSPTADQPVSRPIYAKDVGDEPHLFLDPQLAMIYPETIADSLTIKDSANKAYYLARHQAYNVLLAQLDADIAARLSAITDGDRMIVTEHNSLTHFARLYGLSLVGTLADDGAEKLAQIISEQPVTAAFTEEGLDGTELRELADGAGLRTCHLYTDSIENEEMSYIEMMEANADAIAECLG